MAIGSAVLVISREKAPSVVLLHFGDFLISNPHEKSAISYPVEIRLVSTQSTAHADPCPGYDTVLHERLQANRLRMQWQCCRQTTGVLARAFITPQIDL